MFSFISSLIGDYFSKMEVITETLVIGGCLVFGVQHQLPPLSTTPSFHSFVETNTWKRYGASAFCYSVVLSTSDITSDQFMVAAAFGDTGRLCLYKPGDRKWTILEVLDANEWITDLLFSSGKLYASVISHNKNGVTSGPRNLKFGDHAVELNLVYDKVPTNDDSFEEYDDYLVHLKGTVNSHLVESTTNDEILLVHQVQDKFAKWYDNNHEDDNHEGANEEDNMEGNQDGGEEVNDFGSKIDTVVEDDRDRFYLRTSDFNVYKLHPKKNKIADAKGLGDQLLFLSTAGALSLPATDINNLKGNCIYFATNNTLRLHPRTFTSREIGVFSFDGRKIKRSFPSVHVSVRSRLSWFTPNL
ncbi:hypothetical protein ACLB2K_035960 [Fragaria x ananassa]